jgi:TetR/AcrR family transcriptional repressor of nem operon
VKRDTRLAILEAGASLIHRQGFHRTGLADILSAAGVPKGSFYFYFKSKEEFGLALVGHYRECINERAGKFLTDPGLAPLDRLKAFFAQAREHFDAEGCWGGCPIGNLAQEMSDLSLDMRQAVSLALSDMTGLMARTLAQARDAGDIPAGIEPETLAAFILDAWEGAMMRMKSEKSVEPLRRFEHMVFDLLLR